MYKFFKIIRIPNLGLVALTQLILFQFILKPIYAAHDISAHLKTWEILALIFVTILITLSGYIVNDIVDWKIDRESKLEKAWIFSKVDRTRAWILFSLVVLAGLILSLYLAWSLHYLQWIFLYPLSIILLALYALYLKSSILIGNILVSLFCAGVSGIVLFAEWPSIFAVQQMNPSDFQWILSIFIIYMIYSFYTNLLREIVKDIEDLEGDKNHNIHTLATHFGIQKAKYFTFILTIIFMLAFAVWIIVDPYILTPLLQLLFSILVFLPLVGFAYLLSVSKAQKDFKLLSRYAKFMMAIGVFLLIIIQYAHG